MATKKELFLELANLDKNGKSRWVSINEFVDKYKPLQLGNGGSWCRTHSSLDKKYIIETDKTVTNGNSIDRIRLNGYNTNQSFSQNIRKDIKDYYKNKNCVMLGINGNSVNTKVEIDHKDGRKDNERVSDTKTQKLEDFQPLSKAANDVKRQICLKCKETNKRWNAKNLQGNPFEFYYGDENYTQEVGCVGCYQYDPVEYRKTVVIKVSNMAAKEAVDAVFKKLYPEDENK
jgi:hypothetical protein